MPGKKEDLPTLYKAVAKKVLTESLNVKPGESVTIETWTGGLPLAKSIVLEAKKMGAVPLVTYEDERNYVTGVRTTPSNLLGKMGKHEKALLANTDAYVFIPGPPIAGYYPKITRKEFIDSTSYNESWYEAAKQSRLRGARITSGYVGNELARLLGKERDEIVALQLRAALVNLEEIRSKAGRLLKRMVEGASVTVSSEGAELTAKLAGGIEVQDGVTDAKDVEDGENMSYLPPGYVYKDFDVKTVDGVARFGPSLTRFGMLRDSEIVVEKGKFATWSSKSSRDVLKALEKVLPEKGRVPSYVIVGLNQKMKFGYAQDRFPEGSVTLGVGFAGIMRKGTLTLDGKTVVSEGKLSAS
jgi:leucyl aminopeptidase (aminopeptidase T)